MNEAPSNESLKDRFGLSRDGFRFTNQVCEKLSTDGGCESSMDNLKKSRC
ncbi:hypothetical protein Hanom_Chr14g01335641 [Helianthus anomalus]